MSKYDRLGAYLRQQGLDRVPMTFAEIERVVGTKLPKSQKHQAWWSNSTSNNVMTQVWLDAGYRTEHVDTAAKRLVFKRIDSEYGVPPVNAQQDGMAETQTAYKHEPGKHPRSPLWGAMKGTFTLVPPSEPVKPKGPDDWEGLSLAKLDRLLFGIE